MMSSTAAERSSLGRDATATGVVGRPRNRKTQQRRTRVADAGGPGFSAFRARRRACCVGTVERQRSGARAPWRRRALAAARAARFGPPCRLGRCLVTQLVTQTAKETIPVDGIWPLSWSG